jgi:hypothetical protein
MNEPQYYTDKSRIAGVGLFVNRDYQAGETIGYVHGPTEVIRVYTPEISAAVGNWIGAGRYTWINTNESPYRFINHSCRPNVAIVTKRKVIALTDIPAGSEIVMDYSLTEAEDAWRMQPCLCGETCCRDIIGPIMTIPRKTYEKYKEYIPKNFRRIYELRA